MAGLSANVRSVVRPAIVGLVLLVLVVLLGTASGLGGLSILTVVLWLAILGVIAAGILLIVGGGLPLAGTGTIITAVAILLAFFWLPDPAPVVWSLAFFVGVLLIALGTRADTINHGAWPLLLPRVAVGWALVDNAQDHFRTNWLPGGGGFLRTAQGAATHPPTYFLDPPYQDFLKGTVVPDADSWAAFTISGELAFGLCLAVGLFTPVAAVGAMWLNGNYMLMKAFVSHGAYTDKTFFLVELFCLITLAGLAYGLDASLRRLVPPWVAQMLMGVPEAEPTLQPQGRPATRLI